MTTGDLGTEGYFLKGVICWFLDSYVFHMSERLPNTSSAHAVQHSHTVLPALQTGIWKHGEMFSA